MISTKKLQIVPDFLYPSDCFNHSRISCSLPATQGQYFVIKILCFSRGPTVPHSAMSSGHLLPHILGQGLCLRKCWLPSHEHRVRKEEISKDLNDFSGAGYNKTSFSGFLPNGLCLPSNTSLSLLSLLAFSQALLMVLVLGWVFVPIYIKAGVSIHTSSSEPARSYLQHALLH